MSLRILLPVILAAGLSACATQTPVAFSPADACAQTAANYESREVQCRIPAQFAGKLRFKANLAGGHDDTVARLDAFMNDVPLACNEGSKTWLSAEDGDVSLWCDVAGLGGGAFKFVVKFSHAEYVNYEVAEQ